MAKKVPSFVKDGIVGLGIGTGMIIPGISGATIAVIFGAYKKIVDAVRNLFTKNFWKNLLILLPFFLGAIISFVGFMIPIKIAFDHCMFAIICLFAALIIGSLPGVVDNVRGAKPNKVNWVVFVLAILLATSLGVASVLVKSSTIVDNLFTESPWYLYIVLLILGILAATGITVPGFSASMLLLVLGFYYPLIDLVHIHVIVETPLRFFGILGTFGIGVVIGYFLFTLLMHHCIHYHRQSTYFAIIGFIVGSLVSIFVNSQMFEYFKTGLTIYDMILSPLFVIVGLAGSYLMVLYVRKRPRLQEEQKVEENNEIVTEEK